MVAHIFRDPHITLVTVDRRDACYWLDNNRVSCKQLINNEELMRNVGQYARERNRTPDLCAENAAFLANGNSTSARCSREESNP